MCVCEVIMCIKSSRGRELFLLCTVEVIVYVCMYVCVCARNISYEYNFFIFFIPDCKFLDTLVAIPFLVVILLREICVYFHLK